MVEGKLYNNKKNKENHLELTKIPYFKKEQIKPKNMMTLLHTGLSSADQSASRKEWMSEFFNTWLVCSLQLEEFWDGIKLNLLILDLGELKCRKNFDCQIHMASNCISTGPTALDICLIRPDETVRIPGVSHSPRCLHNLGRKFVQCSQHPADNSHSFQWTTLKRYKT